MLVGYARVSTPEQNLDFQRDALEKAGCERTFTDVASGARAERQGLIEALDFLWAGDTLRRLETRPAGAVSSTSHRDCERTGPVRQVGFRSVQEAIDTTTAGGKLIFHFSALWPSLNAILSAIARRLAPAPREHEDTKVGGPELWMSGRSHSK